MILFVLWTANVSHVYVPLASSVATRLHSHGIQDSTHGSGYGLLNTLSHPELNVCSRLCRSYPFSPISLFHLIFFAVSLSLYNQIESGAQPLNEHMAWWSVLRRPFCRTNEPRSYRKHDKLTNNKALDLSFVQGFNRVDCGDYNTENLGIRNY